MRELKVTLNSQASMFKTSCLYIANELENKRSWALKTECTSSFLVVTNNISLLKVKESIIRKLACFWVLYYVPQGVSRTFNPVCEAYQPAWAERLNSYEMQILWAFFCTSFHLLRVGDIPIKYYADYSWISTYCCLPLLLFIRINLSK